MKIAATFRGRRKPELVRALNDETSSVVGDAAAAPPADDGRLLDSYAQTVSEVPENWANRGEYPHSTPQP